MIPSAPFLGGARFAVPSYPHGRWHADTSVCGAGLASWYGSRRVHQLVVVPRPPVDPASPADRRCAAGPLLIFNFNGTFPTYSRLRFAGPVYASEAARFRAVLCGVPDPRPAVDDLAEADARHGLTYFCRAWLYTFREEATAGGGRIRREGSNSRGRTEPRAHGGRLRAVRGCTGSWRRTR